MHFTKPAWVMHKDSVKSDQNSKRVSIFSVHVHPDGSRIATGGLDAKIRIWRTKPILNEESENSGKPPKSLCTSTMHTGPVLTRAPSGDRLSNVRKRMGSHRSRVVQSSYLPSKSTGAHLCLQHLLCHSSVPMADLSPHGKQNRLDHSLPPKKSSSDR